MNDMTAEQKARYYGKTPSSRSRESELEELLLEYVCEHDMKMPVPPSPSESPQCRCQLCESAHKLMGYKP